MLTEKLFISGYVTADCLNDAVNGPSDIISVFEHALIKRAADLGYVLLPKNAVKPRPSGLGI